MIISRKKKRFLKKLLGLISQAGLFFMAGILMVAVFAVIVFFYIAGDLPDLEGLSQNPMAQSTKILDRTGEVVLYDVYGEEKRTIVRLENISQDLKNATIAIEDDRFYKHSGVDFRSIFRAFFVNLTKRAVAQGGSTITQQLIKNHFLTKERTISRKLKEAVLAIKVERKYSKDEILGFYLNQIPYGENAYGAEAASLTFFGKRANELSLAQSALLASLPKAPSRLSPYGANKEDLLKRKSVILERMLSLGFITKGELDVAEKEVLIFSQQKKSIKAPHLVMMVKDYLEKSYGDDFILRGGLRVYTTIDWEIQKSAEKIVYESAIENQKKYNARNAALVAVDVKTGQIITMVGSYDYFDQTNDGYVNITTSTRQPGSAFKPFAYATAFEKGFSPSTMVFDLPTEFSSYSDICPVSNIDFSNKNSLCYHPQNYDERFRGPVSLRDSLAQSLNIPSVKTLYLAGIKQTVDTAKKLGISTLKNDYGLSLVLGAAEVRPLEMAAAYAVFANDGKKNNPSFILKIEDSNGDILEEFSLKTETVLSPQTARQINGVLSDNEARATVFGTNSPLYIENLPVAAKTGTTQDYNDAWVIGYSPEISVAVWAGNNNNDKILRSGAGISAAGPIWNKFMKSFFAKYPPSSVFSPPENTISQKDVLNGSFEAKRKIFIDKISKKIATDSTPPELIEEVFATEVHSILYYINKDLPLGDFPENPSADPQFINWETPILGWVSEQNLLGKNYNAPVPTEKDDVHTKQNIPQITILSPQDNEKITSQYLQINTSISAPFLIKQVDFFAGEQFLGSSFQAPHNMVFPTSKISGDNKSATPIKVVAYDVFGNRGEKTINISL